MPRHNRFILPFLAVLMLLGVEAESAGTDGFALVANARSSVPSLTKAEVRALYTGKAKTLGGAAVVVVVRGEDDPLFVQFVDRVFAIPTRALLSKIKQEVFKGEMAKPLKATSDDEVIQMVSSSPGALGVVSSGATGRLAKTVAVISMGD